MLEESLFATESVLASTINNYEAQLAAMQVAWDQEVLDSVTWWSDKYNLDMITLQNNEAIIDQMQLDWDAQVAILKMIYLY